MHYTMLGATGLSVSVAGLGCGGNSRLGLGVGKSEAEAIDVVRAAIDCGVTLFDTAAAYGTESILGKAIQPGERSRVVISTKAHAHRTDGDSAHALPAAEVVASLDRSLANLRTDHVDVFMLHGVPPDALAGVRTEIVPALMAEKAKGKFRASRHHRDRAARSRPRDAFGGVDDDAFAVVMVAFHLMHQNARQNVFPRIQAQRVGTLLMFGGAQHLLETGRARTGRSRPRRGWPAAC